jgi:hypothetical protein
MVLLAALSGCMSTGRGPDMASAHVGCSGGRALEVPGVQGPWGTPVAMAFPYSATRSPGETAARAMLAQSVPLDAVQGSIPHQATYPSGVVRASGSIDPAAGPMVAQAGGAGPAASGPPGVMPGAPPGGMLSPPGVPGLPAPPGMMPPGGFPPGAVAAVGALPPGMPNRFPTKRTEIRFVAPDRMKVSWYAPNPAGKGAFTTTQLEVPGRYNFVQGAIYRLKLSDIPNRPGVDLYPTLEVVPSHSKTDPFLAHSSVPIAFTEEDFEQVAAGNYLVKVIYLPDPQFQDLATTGPDEVVSSRLEPGVDPIAEALRRGSILLVIRLGNIDLEAPNTPAMDAPSPYAAPPACPVPGMMPGMMPGRIPPPMIPYGSPPGRPLAYGPNGPFMMMTPNGPVMVGPDGRPLGGPGGAVALPVPAGAVPTLPAPTLVPTPAPAPQATPGGPVSQKTATPAVQQAQFQSAPTTAQLASQDSTAASGSDAKPTKTSRPRRWWFGSKTEAQ